MKYSFTASVPKFLFPIVLFLTSGTILTPIRTVSGGFVHPGVLISGTQLGYVKTAILQHTEPFYSAYQKALNSVYAHTSYKPTGPPASGVIECGSYSHPDYGCTDESVDSANAYLQALLFNLNGSQIYAQNAINLINAYSYNLREYNNTNAPLQSAWSGDKWTRTAELLKYTPNSGWSETDQQQFITMMYNVSLPLYSMGSGANGNWEDVQIQSMIGLAIFSENQTLFDHAIDFWRQRTPAYFYYHTDGDKPVPAPRGPTYWFNQLVFNSSVDGVCQESCRDLGHMSYGLASILNTAETAFIQGIDLYTEQLPRLTAAMEFHAKYLLLNPIPDYVCNGTGLKLSQSPTFEVGYNAYHNRYNVSLPYSEAHIMTQIRTQSDPAIMFIMIYETLTHGGSPPTDTHNSS